jgi:hypothetical protein
MPYEMRDNHVHPGPDEAVSADELPDAEPGQIFDDAMSRLQTITQEWTEVVRSVRR